jgi:hypothetical protein
LTGALTGMPADRPNVRARKRPVTGALCRLGRRKPDGQSETRFEKLAERLWELALEEKDRMSIRLIMDYCEGKPIVLVSATIQALPQFTGDEMAGALGDGDEWERKALNGSTAQGSGAG